MSTLKLPQRPSLVGLWALALVDLDVPDVSGLLMMDPVYLVRMVSFF